MNYLLKYEVLPILPLPPSAKLLYCYLSDTADRQNRVIKSQKYIARVMGLSRVTVCRSLRRLKRNGLVEITKRRSRDSGKSVNCYTII